MTRGKVCALCFHQKRLVIDLAILRGEPLKMLQRRYQGDFSYSALRRHAGVMKGIPSHLDPELVQAFAEAQQARKQRALEELGVARPFLRLIASNLSGEEHKDTVSSIARGLRAMGLREEADALVTFARRERHLPPRLMAMHQVAHGPGNGHRPPQTADHSPST